MAIEKRYKITPREQPGGDQWLRIELEDFRRDPDDGESRIELEIRHSEGEDGATGLWLTTEEAFELAAVLRTILGAANREDAVLVNGPDAD